MAVLSQAFAVSVLSKGVSPEKVDLIYYPAASPVSRSYTGAEFNLPSKIMNFMAYGLPIVAAVHPDSETPGSFDRLLRKVAGNGAGA